MRILFLTSGTRILASSRSRVYQYLPFLRKAGISCTVVPLNPTFLIRQSIRHSGDGSAIRGYLLSRLTQVIHLARYLQVIVLSPFHDVFFNQKVHLPRRVQKWIEKLNGKMVFDFDDSTFFLRGEDSTVERIFAGSRLVVLENEYNAARVRPLNRNILHITGPIDTDRYTPRAEAEESEGLVIGWIGHPQHAEYLLELEEVFRDLCSRHRDLRIVAIGGGDLRMEGVRLECPEWSLESEVRDLHRFDIGIMPLPDDDVARGKGGYKLLQYMSLAIPSVASPVGINSDLLAGGTRGFLPSGREEWLDALSRLLERRDMRMSMGRAARKFVLDEYSFYAAAPKLIAALRSVAAGKSLTEPS